jgi:hypothetical protein
MEKENNGYFEKQVRKTVKAVWRDSGREKVAIGKLTHVYDHSFVIDDAIAIGFANLVSFVPLESEEVLPQ